jgi:hypothetical protein
MRRVLAPALALLAVLLIASSARAGGPSAQIVGGGFASAGEIPYQVLVLPGDKLCGGSLLDSTHVATAAHCVYDEESGTVVDPRVTDVFGGLIDLNQVNGAPHAAVTAVAIDPDYDPARITHDAAVLTLATPLSGTGIAPIDLAAAGTAPLPGTDLVVSGWGTTQQRPADTSPNTDDVSDLLKDLHIAPSAGCTIYRDYTPAFHLCAGGQTSEGVCQGDSGGPLVETVGGVPKLVGIVSATGGCGLAGFPTVFARVAQPAIHQFLVDRGVGHDEAAPVPTTAPSILGAPVVGSSLFCQPGAWSGAKSYAFRFEKADGTLLARSQALPVTPALAGTSVRCVVTATALTLEREAASAEVAIPAPGPAAPGAGMATPDPSAAATPQPAGGATPPLDTTPPVARITKVRCGRTVCVLDVKVVDPAPSSGVSGLQARVSTAYRATCGTGRKRHGCTRTIARSLPAVSTSPTTMRVVTPHLRKGTQTFSLVGVDLRGNRQVTPTKLTRRLG